mmetsp:Transcript_9870/g.22451  ORF Transcript_9870/g.22451 Transcript_9870/m.22451 type:complete len:249 (-) Transcript_9870:155-901(-)|eukprot:4934544-Amphidinium_carterae.2
MTCVEQPVCELPQEVLGGLETEMIRKPSQHFSVSTPRSARSPVSSSKSVPPRPAVSPVKSTSSAAALPQSCRDEGHGQTKHEQLDGDVEKMYEWQFEILNTFPREKGIALVDYLKVSHRSRLEAINKASELGLHVENLQEGLNQCRRWRWWRLLGWPVLISLALSLGVLLGHMYQLGPLLEAYTGRVLVDSPPQTCPGIPDDIETMREEHELMTYQIQRMQLDIEDAKKNGRPLVCWPVGEKEEGEED